MGAVNAASMMITLMDSSQRTRDIWQVMDGVRDEAVRTIPGIRRLSIKEMGADVMASSAAPIQVIIYRAGPRDACRAGRTDAQAGGRDTGFRPGLHFLVHDAPAAPRRGGSGPRAGDWPHGRGGGEPGLLRAEGGAHQRVLPCGQPAPLYHPSPIPRGPAEGPVGSRAGEDRGEEGRGRPRSRSLARLEERPGPTLIERDNFRRVVSVLGYYRKGGTAEHGSVHGSADGGPREARTSRRGTESSCAET